MFPDKEKFKIFFVIFGQKIKFVQNKKCNICFKDFIIMIFRWFSADFQTNLSWKGEQRSCNALFQLGAYFKIFVAFSRKSLEIWIRTKSIESMWSKNYWVDRSKFCPFRNNFPSRSVYDLLPTLSLMKKIRRLVVFWIKARGTLK